MRRTAANGFAWTQHLPCLPCEFREGSTPSKGRKTSTSPSKKHKLPASLFKGSGMASVKEAPIRSLATSAGAMFDQIAVGEPTSQANKMQHQFQLL